MHMKVFILAPMLSSLTLASLAAECDNISIKDFKYTLSNKEIIKNYCHTIVVKKKLSHIYIRSNLFNATTDQSDITRRKVKQNENETQSSGMRINFGDTINDLISSEIYSIRSHSLRQHQETMTLKVRKI